MDAIEVLANTTVVIILQYINTSNEHIVHLKHKQCYVSITSQFFFLKSCWTPQNSNDRKNSNKTIQLQKHAVFHEKGRKSGVKTPEG